MTWWHILVFWLDKRATDGGTSPAVHIMNRALGPVCQERYGERRTRMLNEGPAGERAQWEEAWRGMPLLTHPHCLSFHPFFCPPPHGWQEGGLTLNDSDKLATVPMMQRVYTICVNAVHVCFCYVWLKCHWRHGYCESLGSSMLGRVSLQCPLFFSIIGCVSLCACVCVFGKSG